MRPFQRRREPVIEVVFERVPGLGTDRFLVRDRAVTRRLLRLWDGVNGLVYVVFRRLFALPEEPR